MTVQPAAEPASLDPCVIALDQEVARAYAAFLIRCKTTDSIDSRQKYCAESGVHPKLLYNNPHFEALKAIFGNTSNFERLKNTSLWDWTLYHHHYVHQAYRYGDPKMQQRWMGHDILKNPLDCWIYQELMHDIKPDFVIELGIMFGGATHFYASLCDLIDHGQVLGVDIDISKVKSIQNSRIQLIEGSSTSSETFERVKKIVNGGTVLVIADSDHEKNHCLGELRLYSQLVTLGSYFVMEDSLNDPMHWHPVPNEGPQAAALAFLGENTSFVADRRYAERYLLSLNPSGYLKRIGSQGL